MAKISELRHSALILGSGPGSFVDLPNWSVTIAGIDSWPVEDCAVVEDPRLLDLVQRTKDGQHVQELRRPPIFDDVRTSRRIAAYVFPGWFTVRVPNEVERKHGRPLVYFGDLRSSGKGGSQHRFQPRDWEELREVAASKKNWKYSLIPVRFVRACRFGHCADVNWEELVHGGHRCMGRARLWLQQSGASGELSDLTVRCSACDAKYSLAHLKEADTAAENAPRPLGFCDGHAPWLREANGKTAKLGCAKEDGKPEPWRLLVRHASNAYFARTLSTVWLPPEASGLQAFVEQYWTEDLQFAKSPEDVQLMARKGPLRQAMDAAGWDAHRVWDAIVARSRAPAAGPRRSQDPKRPELEQMLASKTDAGDFARPDSDFTVRSLPRHRFDPDGAIHLAPVLGVFLAHRLRVTTVLRGFTRLEPLLFPVSSEVDLDVQSADLAHPKGVGGKPRTNWLPAVASRGEGILVRLDTDAVQAWRQRPAVLAHIGKYYEELVRLSPDFFRPGSNKEEQQLELASYMLLHSLSHALLQAVAMDCGYAPPSMSERIYNYDDAFAVLLYTTSPDAEGTLGGLVQSSQHLAQHLAEALRRAALCSNDPVCAAPTDKKRSTGVAGGRTVNGAACHACLLISESSCERRNNDLLDRALLVPTVAEVADGAAAAELAFWPEVPEE